MKTHTSLVVALAAAAVAGCFGSDPNMNSQLLDGSSTTGAAGSGTGAGGAGPSVTGPIVGSPIAVFASTTEGFQLNAYHDTGNTNLGDPASGANPPPTVGFDATAGSPDPGALKIVATYTGANQYVDIQKNMASTPQDWRGKTLHVRLKVASGSYGGGAQVYALTVPNQFVFGGTFTNVAKTSNWQEFTVNLDAPMTENSGYDPSQVIVVGVQLNTGTMGGTSGEVVFNIDSFSIDPPGAGAAGAGGSGGAAGAAGGSGGAAGGSGGAAGAAGAAGGSSDASAGG